MNNPQPTIVVLDAGHDSPDPGAVRGKLYEKDINLNITREVARVLRKHGLQVRLTRLDDNDMANSYDEKLRRRRRADLQQRIHVIQDANANAVVSIHCNWSRNTAAHGAIVLFHSKGQEGERLANHIVESLRQTNIKADASRSLRSLYILKHTKAPCVLVEVGFLTNGREAKRLATRAYQEKLAMSVAKGIETYLDICPST